MTVPEYKAAQRLKNSLARKLRSGDTDEAEEGAFENTLGKVLSGKKDRRSEKPVSRKLQSDFDIGFSSDQYDNTGLYNSHAKVRLVANDVEKPTFRRIDFKDPFYGNGIITIMTGLHDSEIHIADTPTKSFLEHPGWNEDDKTQNLFQQKSRSRVTANNRGRSGASNKSAMLHHREHIQA